MKGIVRLGRNELTKVIIPIAESERNLIEERQSLLKTQKERTDLLAQCDIFESQIRDLQKSNDQLQGDLERVTSDGGQLSTKLQGEVDVLRRKLDGKNGAVDFHRWTVVRGHGG